MSGNKVSCPCKNFKFVNVKIIKHHLEKYGFVDNYFVWKHQGEKDVIGEISSDRDL